MLTHEPGTKLCFSSTTSWLFYWLNRAPIQRDLTSVYLLTEPEELGTSFLLCFPQSYADPNGMFFHRWHCSSYFVIPVHWDANSAGLSIWETGRSSFKFWMSFWWMSSVSCVGRRIMGSIMLKTPHKTSIADRAVNKFYASFIGDGFCSSSGSK